MVVALVPSLSFSLSLWSGGHLLGLLWLENSHREHTHPHTHMHPHTASTAPVELKAIHTATGRATDSDMA